MKQEIVLILIKVLTKEARVLTEEKTQNQSAKISSYLFIIDFDLESEFLSNQFNHLLLILIVQKFKHDFFQFFCFFCFLFCI